MKQLKNVQIRFAIGFLSAALGFVELDLRGEAIYIAQTALGANTGVDAANAHSASWFNTVGNWGSGADKLGPGDTAWLVGNITSVLATQASGTSGNEITIKFDAGAKMSKTTWGEGGVAFSIDHDYIVLDGNNTGIIEATANGRLLANQHSFYGVQLNNVDFVTVKNLTITNLYVRGGPVAADYVARCRCISINYSRNVLIQSNALSYASSGIFHLVTSSPASAANTFDRNTIYSCNAGILVGDDGGGGAVARDFVISGNHIELKGEYGDLGGDHFHMDGIHIFCNSGEFNGFKIVGNQIGPDMGGGVDQDVTAWIFLEFRYKNFLLVNNLILNANDLAPTDAYIFDKGASGYVNNTRIANNTIYSHGITGNGIELGTAGMGADIANNIFVNVNDAIYLPSGRGAFDSCDYNLYYNFATIGGQSSFSNWRSSVGSTDAHSINLNPSLDAGFAPNAASPAIDKGTSQSTYFTTDKNGNARSGTWDIGAYEYGAGALDSVPPKITNISVDSISASSANITWVTDELSTSIVDFGLTASYGNVASNGDFVAVHSVALSALSPSSTYQFRVKAGDAVGNVGSSSNVSFSTLAADLDPPAVILTAPTANAVLDGDVTLLASSSDTIGVAGVKFLVDGGLIGSEDTASPYSLVWSSISVTNGYHSIQARARDASGNVATSTSVVVQVQNDLATMLASGLVGYWKFDEGNGSSSVSSVGSVGTATLNSGSSWGEGKSGFSLELDGAIGKAAISDSPTLRLSGSFCLSFWVNHSSLPTSGKFMHYLEKGQDDHDNFGTGIVNVSQGLQLYFEFEDVSGTYQRVISGSPLSMTTGVWVNLVIVFDASTGNVRFFKDGIDVGQVAVAERPNPNVNFPVTIGQENFAGWEWPLHGALDELRIYNRPLSFAEIQALYGNGRPAPPVGLHIREP